MEVFKIKSLANFESLFKVEQSKYKPENEWVHYSSLNAKNEILKILADVLTEVNKNKGYFFSQVYNRIKESINKNDLKEVNSIDWIIEEVSDDSNIKYGFDITGTGVIFNTEFAPHILVESNTKMIFIFDDFKKTKPIKIELELFEKLLTWSNKVLNRQIVNE